VRTLGGVRDASGCYHNRANVLQTPLTDQFALVSASKSFAPLLMCRPGLDAGTHAKDGELEPTLSLVHSAASPSLALDSGIPAGMTGFASISLWRGGAS
jgi:hypothetical protein